MFTDDQVVFSDSEVTLREIKNIILDCNFEISIQKTERIWHSEVNGL
jgi:hypothetical protein